MTNEPEKRTQKSGSSSSDDLSEYLQVFIDESAEELDALVESILKLETNPQDDEALHKAFRMLHSLKGSCGMMGFEIVGTFAHDLEDRFEKYRSGKDVLDRDTATLVLKCIDYFRDFIDRLRSGDSSEGDPSLLSRQLTDLAQNKASDRAHEPTHATVPQSPRHPSSPAMTISGGIRITIRFKTGLQLADLKARLIIAKLSAIGEVIDCEPSIDDVSSFEELSLFSLTILTDRQLADVMKIANVDGVDSIEFEESMTIAPLPVMLPMSVLPSGTTSQPSAANDTPAFPAGDAPSVPLNVAPLIPAIESQATDAELTEGKGPVNETLRIGIDRLDRLMNLTGELVVANSRFSQITGEMSPVFRRNTVFNKAKDLTERLRSRFDIIRKQAANSDQNGDRWIQAFEGLDDELNGLEEQSELWAEGHRHYLEIAEAVDQLTRVSKNLQAGVLNTRMVPVGPLFNRFKRVMRDLSVDRGKLAQLTIAGEKTELDKRMIDSLGDPLLHLVRNAIDHGLESPEQRRAAGKPETGTITLSASHRGNNVLILVQDDGGGIDREKICSRIIMRGLATEAQVQEMTEQKIMEFIWAPGFSTAETITEVSGRGVGMDIVRNTIAGLSGTIDITSTLGKGTTFTIRLPLTLAIIHSLLIRFRDSFFSIPIDDVREIVSVTPENIYSVHRHQTIDIRGELIPLATMDVLFEWNRPASPAEMPSAESHPAERLDGGISAESPTKSRTINVVLLSARGKTMGLCVDALVGRADIVIKSLSENFIAIRGLSGASIMGDGSVCLMLDSTTLIELATERATARSATR